VIETYLRALQDAKAGERFAFVTHNKSDFSLSNGNQKLPHPDLEEHFSKIKSMYFINLAELPFPRIAVLRSRPSASVAQALTDNVLCQQIGHQQRFSEGTLAGRRVDTFTPFRLTVLIYKIKADSRSAGSLNRHAFRQITRLIHIRSPGARRVICQQLQRHDVQ
jgi:hypothetical protein